MRTSDLKAVATWISTNYQTEGLVYVVYRYAGLSTVIVEEINPGQMKHTFGAAKTTEPKDVEDFDIVVGADSPWDVLRAHHVEAAEAYFAGRIEDAKLQAEHRIQQLREGAAK